MNEQLNLEQSQKTLLHLSPQQVQFVRMLEMNTAEIEDKVRHELDENPALEAVTPLGDNNDDNEGSDFNETSDDLLQADYLNDEDMPSLPSSGRDSVATSLEINPSTQTMGENLIEQLSEYDLDTETRQIATYIIGTLDNNGRLTRPYNAIADDITIHTGHETTTRQVMDAAEYVRQLDPAGVGAIDLRDCLLLQIKRREPKTLTTRIAGDILDHYFDEFSNLHYDKIRTRMGIDRQQLKEAIEVIKSLNPKPGNDSASDIEDRLRHVNPDFYIEPHDDGSYSLGLTHRIPQLVVEQSFRPDSIIASQANDSGQSAAFIKGRRDQAEGFISLLKRRDETLMAVIKAIVKIQHKFFVTEDPANLSPMILKDIAALTGLDLSVISRATSGKYIATPAAIYPLKMFFNERPHDDSDTTSHQILKSIKELIENEDGASPLSDQAIQDRLKSNGLNIARRTVTKYREKMSIPPARLRRKL